MTNSAKTNIAAFAGALGISLAPVLADSIHSQVPTSIPRVEQVERATNSGVVYLPIKEATAFLRSDADVLRGILESMKALRAQKGGGLLFSVADRVKMVKAAKKHAQFIFELKSAIRIALKDLSSPEERRASLIDFGKAVAGAEFILQDVLAAYDQAKAPEKSLNTAGLIDSEDAKIMVEEEHKKLGLFPPSWSC